MALGVYNWQPSDDLVGELESYLATCAEGYTECLDALVPGLAGAATVDAALAGCEIISGGLCTFIVAEAAVAAAAGAISSALILSHEGQ